MHRLRVQSAVAVFRKELREIARQKREKKKEIDETSKVRATKTKEFLIRRW